MAKRRRGIDKSLSERIAGSVNSQIATFLYEWFEQAAMRNDRLQFIYRRVLDNELQTPIATFRELERLHGIGSNIRQRLERCCQEAGLVLGDAQNLITDEQSAQQESEEQVPKRKKTTTPKEYVPSFRSGPYAMLLALYIGTIQSSSSKDYLGKSEIVTLGQPYCLAPMEEGMFSPLQGAIKTLTSKGLVDKQGIPARFKLTAEGSDLAARLWNSGERRSSAPLPVNEDIVPIERAKVDNHESIIESFVLPKDSFEIVLIVDTREVKSREERDFIINKLNDAGIRSEQRSLELGDFVWIARAPDEVVLDYIVERKREDDLISSIIDGRFREQKFRLRASGLTNRIYLVEKGDNTDYRVISKERFDTAIAQTQIVDGMFLRYTGGLEETLRFLTSMTRDISARVLKDSVMAITASYPVRKEVYLEHVRTEREVGKCSVYQTFGCFTQINSKSANLTIKDIFLKQLLTIRQLTAEKAFAIVERFPTATALCRHYRQLDTDREREEYFKNWAVEDSERRFGTALSKRIYHLFCAYSYKEIEAI